jgi:hypothetical protein
MSDTSFASVEESFVAWRSSRSSRAESIPERLWSMALSLYPEYKRSHICAALRISGAQFKRRLECGSTIDTNNGFVLASRNERQQTSLASREIQLRLEGQRRSMTLYFDRCSLGEVLPLVSALL